MRIIFLLSLLTSLAIVCQSQATTGDSFKELNDLKDMRQKLTVRSAELVTVIDRLQHLKDSINIQLDKTKKTVILHKDAVSANKNGKTTQEDKGLMKTTKLLDKISQQQKVNRQALQDVSDLIKEFDTKIIRLSKKR
jgi:hypothetical protein